MDQVREIAKIIWEQRFWVLSALGIIIALVCWNMSTGTLQAEFEDRQGSITNNYQQVNRLRGQPFHPNEGVNQTDREEAVKQKANVLSVWQDLYQKQREEVLSWPEALGAEFLSNIQDRSFGDPLTSSMQDKYLNYIQTQFDSLLEIVKAKKDESRSTGRGRGGGEYAPERGRRSAAADEDQDHLVLWLDQSDVRQQLEFNTKPTSMEIWVTQEDLWVYETLLTVIADTNEEREATRPDNTAIAAIVSLDVGQEAAAAKGAGTVMIPAGPADQGAGEYDRYSELGGRGGGEYMSEGRGAYPGGEMREYGGERGAYGDMGRGGTGRSGPASLANRYLDEAGEPIASSEPPADAQFRKLPIQMVLMMDQRWISPLLVECANAALPVEVTQLRINPSQSGDLSGRQRSRIPRDLEAVAQNVPLDEVHVSGVVYIYTEPDPSTLSIEGVVDEPELVAEGI